MPKRSGEKSFTAKALNKLKAAPEGERYERYDRDVAGFGVRVTDKRRRSFILNARLPGKSPARHVLGDYSSSFTLEDARKKARLWKEQIRQGIDPRDVEERERLAREVSRKNTFAAVAEDFIAEKVIGPDPAKPIERKGREVERDIRNEFVPVWGPRPITEISDVDIVTVIKARKLKGRSGKAAPAQARNLLATAKRLFGWAVDQRIYGLKASPAESLKPAKIIGPKIPRDRVLSDDEFIALWRAAERTPYPHGPAYQLLILTALRLNEAADASWPEFDIGKQIWTIPAERMKGKNGNARAHAVPLTDDILAIIDDRARVPRFKGRYLFSTTHGESPTHMSSKVKDRVDALMIDELSKMAEQRGDDPSKVKLAPWTNHDIRRTVRTRLSRLKITAEAREAVLAHVKSGIIAVYDHHEYLDEKREALTQWAACVRGLVTPPTANVVQLHGRV